MNLRNVDLNLLIVLDALLDEAHVSRAALRLNMTQPAVSNALQRCRDLFRDPLLERGRGIMYRTAKAEALRAPLKSLLLNVVDLVDPPAVDLKDIKQIVRITTSDDPVAIIAGPLIAALSVTAPRITVVFQPWHGSEATLQQLRDEDADLAISVFENDIEHIDTHILIEEDYVVAMRAGHPAAEDFGLDVWLDWPHILVSGQGALRSPLDKKLETMGRSRKVGVVVPSFQMIPRILTSSSFMAMVPRRSLALHGREDIAIFEPPVSVSGFPLHLAWHKRREKDLGLQHVAETVKTIFDGLGV